MLKINNLSAGYQKNTMILNDFSLELNAGERIGIIGQNGCGKSTLTKALMGITPYIKGSFLWENNTDLTNLSVHQKNKLGIAYFMQGGRIFGNLTVKENLEIVSSKKKKEKFEDILLSLQEYDLSLFSDERRLNLLAENLSGGEKHILSFVMVVLGCPNMKLLIADEPSAGVAQIGQKQILKMMKSVLYKNNTALILIEQNKDFFIVGGVYWYMQQNEKKNVSNNDEKVIKVGAILPLSGGSSSDAGHQIKNGIELYKNEFNKTHKQQIDVVYGDSKNSAASGISAYKKLKMQGVKYFLASNSGVVVPLVNELKKDKENLLMTTVNSAAGVPESGKNVFRVFVSIQNETKTMAKYIGEKLGLKKISVLYINDEFGKSGLETFGKNNVSQILFQEAFDKSAIDFKNVISKLPKESEAVYVIGYDNALGLIVKQLRELGYKNKIFTTIGMSVAPWRAKAGEAANGVSYTGINFNQNSKDKQVVDFVNRFKKEFDKEDVTSFNVFAYFSFKIFADAIASCENQNNQCVINKINNSSTQSIMGKINIDNNGEADLPLSIYVFDNGKQEVVE